jgi:CheY-like chemotaxis protein
VAQTLKSLYARTNKKGLRLLCHMQPGLPERVIGDPVRIGQVLTNLCDNAIKFTAQGDIVVSVGVEPSGSDVLKLKFSVQDSGIGIPAEKQQGIFEAFNQADTSTTRQFGGTGLGLTICARLVSLMGGSIWVESTPSVGSTFLFTITLQPANTAPQAAPDAPADAIQAMDAPQPSKLVLQILLVEDHPINQMLATTLLKKWGHTVVLAQNGQEAVDLFPSKHWDLVLMDMQMPVMGGLEATRLIRAGEESGHRIPIIAMTANAMEADRKACLEAGMDEHLAKPFNANALLAILERIETAV